VPEKGESIVYVRTVNYEQAKAQARGFEVELVQHGKDLMTRIARQIKTLKITKLAVDALSYENYRSLINELRGSAKLKIRGDLVSELRKVKSEEELDLMRKAGDLVSEGMKVAYEVIKPGIREYEVAAEIEHTMRRQGSWGTAFDTIVASGARSAFPHGGCTDRKIKDGDLVVLDVGAVYEYYRSDMTRTAVAGKPSRKQENIYEIVRSAQEKAFQAIKHKAKAKDVDAAARRVIARAGYGEYFVHGLGHGVGLEIHEPPTLDRESKDRLVFGNVVTNEPGVYIPDFGGFRIEDTVLVRKRSGENLTVGSYTLKTG
jgi:Xaa-Pro aminopeptidase